MFAARAIARAAPRIASRNLTTATRHTFASTSRQVAIRSQIPAVSFKCFSTSRPHLDAAAQELAAKLENELQLENENSDTMAVESEENVKTYLDSRDWQVTDNEGEQSVKLSRKYDDETIEVQFTVADFPPSYGEEEEMDEALLDEADIEGQSGGGNSKAAVSQGRTSGGNIKVGQNQDVAPGDRDELRDAEDESAAATPFPASVSVTIRRDGKQGVLRFELVAEDGDFSISSITPLSDSDAKAVDAAGYTTGAEKSWSGPPFQQLDEELQSFFENYLTERGIDSALALVVPEYIDLKEQKEYLGWLKKVKEFVD